MSPPRSRPGKQGNCSKISTNLEKKPQKRLHTLASMERAVAEQRAELEQLAGTLDEQRKDLEVLAARELELLALNKDLSEVNCLLQQEIATQESKTIAITLEYGKFVSMCQEYDAQIVSLANSLAAERQHRTEERLLMAKHIADRTRKLEQAESCLQQTLNELEANRKKYFALVKVKPTVPVGTLTVP